MSMQSVGVAPHELKDLHDGSSISVLIVRYDSLETVTDVDGMDLLGYIGNLPVSSVPSSTGSSRQRDNLKDQGKHKNVRRKFDKL